MKLSHLLFAALLLLSAAAAPAAQRTFDLRATALAPAPTAAEDGGVSGISGDGLLRAAEAPAADAGALAPGDEVTLLLFDGERVDLTIEEAAPATVSGARAFLARTEGSPFRDAVLLADADGALHATVEGRGGGSVLRVFPRGGATAVTLEDVPEIECGGDSLPAPAPAAADAGDGAGAELPAAVAQSDQLVDILVAFELGAKAWAENNGGTTNFAEMAVQKMNLALANSDLDDRFRFRLVGVAFADVRTTALREALDAALSGAGGWAPIRAMREARGADVVTVLVDTGFAAGTTGLGYPLTAQDASSGARFSAVNSCAVRAVATSHTMTHEVGHNLGCGHSNAAGATTPGPQSFPYSSGYHFTGSSGTRWHSIMAYNALNGEIYQPAGVFSSPLLTVDGVAAGTADENDNRRVLAQSWAWAQGWREQVLPLAYDVFFTPEGDTAISGSLAVTIEPGRAGLEIRYTTDGSAPTLSSPVYTGPITLTQTTTIRAAAVFDGALGPVGTARYFVPDLAEALDTPDLVWTSGSSSNPWTFQVATTWDGVDAVQSGSPTSAYAWPTPSLSATIAGPTSMSFRWCGAMHTENLFEHTGEPKDKLAVYVDGTEVWSDAAAGWPSPWKLAQVDVPAGSHTVDFRFLVVENVGSAVGETYSAWIDDVRFDALSRAPMIAPATTGAESTATTFAGSLEVSLASEGAEGTMIFYTTDGSDPTADGVLYEAPFTIAASTRVRAVAVEPGREASVETEALYLERHRPVRPGEWSSDADGLLADAAADSGANLILGYWCADAEYPTCVEFRAVAEDPAFAAWCAANGVYLLRSDPSVYPEGDAAHDLLDGWMKQLHPSSSSPYGPMVVAATPDHSSFPADALTLTSGTTFGSKTYQGTADSLVACLAAIIGKTAPSAPTATPDSPLVAGFPVSVSLANPNSSGTIRYTLDGSAPTRSSTAWSGGSIRIQRGQILSAAVFPSGSSDLSSPVLVRNYRTVAGFFGIPEDAFDWSPDAGDYPWRIDANSVAPRLRSGNDGVFNYGPTYESVLRATARAAGTLTFQFGDMSLSGNTSIFTAPDGTQTTVRSSTGTVMETKMLSVSVQPGDVLKWTRDVDNAYQEQESIVPWGASVPVRCGAYLAQVVWTPDGGGDEPPALGTVAASATTTSATISVPVAQLGEGSEGVTVKVSVAGVEKTQTLSAPGTATFVFDGLSPDTSYTAAVTATGSNGLSASATASFTTAAAEPPAGTVSVGTPDFASNTATVNVTALGDGAASVAITLEYSTDASFASARTVDLGSVSAPGAKTATLGDLAAGTTYHVRAVLTGAKTTTTAAVSFTTRSYTPPALGAVSVTTTKTAATLTVPVTSLGDGGASVTVSATLGGATKTATLSAAGEATFVFDGLTADTEYAWSVSATAAPTGLAATPQSGVATTQGVQKETKGWFFVDLSDAGYAAFPDVSGVATPGGTWSGAGEYSATYSAASRTLAIARAENAAADAELRYTPTKPTESGCDAEVRGTIRPNAVSILPAPPSGPLGGIVFLRRGGRAVPHGLADGAWHELSPSVAEGADVAWEAIFDFSSASKPRVRYAIGATTNAWIALASGTKLSAVSFRGAGTLGSFRGAYARVVGSFAKPEFGAASADGSALGFGTDPATGRATFSVTIDNATAAARYAVYVCETVDGDYVLDQVRAGADGDLAFTLDGESPTRFVKIVAAEPGYEFPQRLADIEF